MRAALEARLLVVWGASPHRPSRSSLLGCRFLCAVGGVSAACGFVVGCWGRPQRPCLTQPSRGPSAHSRSLALWAALQVRYMVLFLEYFVFTSIASVGNCWYYWSCQREMKQTFLRYL